MSTSSNRISFQYVKVGTSTYSGNADTVNVAFNKINSNFTAIANSLSNILVPIANTITTGSVRIGQGINVTPDGTISVGQTVHIGAPGHLTGDIGDSVGTIATDNNLLYISTGSFSPSYAFNPIYDPTAGGTFSNTGTTATILAVSTSSLATTSTYVFSAATTAAVNYESGTWVVYDDHYNAYPVTQLVAQRGTTPVTILTLNTTTSVSSGSVFYVATQDVWHRIPYINHAGKLPVSVIPYQVGDITYSYSTVTQGITVIGTTAGDLTLQPQGNTIINSALQINGALSIGAPLSVSTSTSLGDYNVSPAGNILLQRPVFASTATTVLGRFIATATLTHYVGGISLGPMIGAPGEAISTNVTQQDLYVLPYGDLYIGNPGKAVSTHIYGNTDLSGSLAVTADLNVDHNIGAPVFRIPAPDSPAYHVLQNINTQDLNIQSHRNTFLTVTTFLNVSGQVQATDFTGVGTYAYLSQGADVRNGLGIDQKLTLANSTITASNGNDLTITGGANTTDSVTIKTNNTFGTVTLTASNASAVLGQGIVLKGNSNSSEVDITDSVYVKSGSSTWKFDQYGRIIFPNGTVQLTAFTANPLLQGLTVTNVALINQLTVQTTATINGQLLVNNTATISQDLNVLGSTIISGNLTVLGANTIVNSTSTAVADPVIDIGGGPNGTMLTANDGLDKGIVLHYFDTQNTRMFLGRDSVTGRLHLRDNIDPGVGPAVNSDFSIGGAWGGASFGSLKLLGGATASGSNNGTGDLQISGGVGIAGDLYVGGTLNLSGNELTIGSASFNNGLTISGSQTPATEYFTINTGGLTPSTTFQVDSATGNTLLTGTLNVQGATQITGLASLQNNLNLAGDFNLNTNKFTVANVTGNTTVAGTMDITGATTLRNNLNLAGTFAINSNKFLVTGSSGNTVIAGTANIAGNVVSSGTYALAGDLNINVNKFNVQASSGNTSIAGSLNVTAATGLLSTLNVTGAVTMGSTLGLTGDFAVGSNVFTVASASGNTVIQGTLNLTGGAVLSSGLSVAGATYLNSTANVAGDLTVNTNKFTVISTTGNFISVGNGNISGNLTVNNTATIGATLGVTGDATLNSKLSVGGNFAIGTTLFTVGGNSGNTVIAGSLDVAGASSLTSSLYVGGIVTMFSGQTVQGQVAFNNLTESADTATGSLVVAGGTGIAKNLNVGGNFYASKSVTLGAGIQMAGSLQLAGNKFTVSSATGNTVIAGTLQLASDFSINSTQFTVNASNGNTVVNGTLDVKSNTTIAGTQIITAPNSVSDSFVVKGYTTGDKLLITTDPTAGNGVKLSVQNAVGNAYSTFNVYASAYNFNINGNQQVTISNTGVVKMLSNTPSTSTSSGTLQVIGGVGISGDTYIGGNTVVTGNVTAVRGSFSGNVTDNSQRVLVNVVPSGSSGINISSLTKTGSTVTWTINNLGVNTLAGTTNNITVSQSTGSVTVNLGTTGTAGTYAYQSSMTTDQFGRVLSVTANTATGSGPVVLATTPTVNTPIIVGQFTTTAYTGYLYGNASGQVSASTTLPGAVVTGTVPAAYTATVLTATQNFSLSGDISSPTVGFNGTAGVILNGTLATVTQANSGNFSKLTLDTKGRVIGNTPVTALDIATTLGSTSVANASNILVAEATNNNSYLPTFVSSNSSYQAEYVYSGHTFNPGTGILTSPAVAVTATTAAISTNSGALQVAGGAGIAGNLFVGGSTYISGDLIIDGNQTFINSTNIQTGDKSIYLSTASINSSLAVNSGLFVGPTAQVYASITFDGSSTWKSLGSFVPSATGTYGLGTNSLQWNQLYAQAVYDNGNRVITNITQGTGTVVVTTGTSRSIYLSPATTSVMGGVRIGSGLSVAADGLLTTNAATISTATNSSLGVIKVGNYINLSSDATISLPQAIYTTSTVTFGVATITNSLTADTIVANTQVDVAGVMTFANNGYANITAANQYDLALYSGSGLSDNIYITNLSTNGIIGIGNAYITGLTVNSLVATLAGLNSSIQVGSANVTITPQGATNAFQISKDGIYFPDSTLQSSAALTATTTATNLALGYVKIGNNIYGANDGTISVHTATNAFAGAVKIGTGIYISADGTISIPAGGGGVASITAGTGTHITASTGTPVLYIGQAVETTSGVTFGSVTSTGNITDNGNRVITSVTPTGGAGINISSLTSTGPSSSWTINNLGVNSLAGSTNINVSQSTGSVTVSHNTLSNFVVGNVTSTGTVAAPTINDNGNRVITSVTPTAGTAINISSVTTTGPSASFTVNNLGVTALTGAATIKVSASTGSITITDVGVTAIQPGTGITVTANTGSVTVTNAGVLTFNGSTGNVFGVGSLTGTANQITASASTGAVTLSLPQSIATTSNVTFGNITANNVTDNANRVVTSVTPTAGTAINISSLTSTGPSTAFTINNLGVTSLTGSTYLNVSQSTGSVTLTNLGVQTITGTANQVTASASTGAVTLSLPQSIGTTSNVQFGTIGGTTVTATAGASITGGTVTIGPGTAGTMNNVAIGGTTATTAKVTGLTVGYASVTTTPFTATADTYIIGVNRAGPVAITLPAGSAGRVIIVKDESGNASVNNITITPASGTIDGQASLVISANYAAYSLYSSGSNWFIH
jgi:hypothetical protein